MSSIRVLFVTGRLGPWTAGGDSRLEYNLIRYASSSATTRMALLGTTPSSVVHPERHYPSGTNVNAIRTTESADTLGDIAISNLLYPTVASRSAYDIIHFNILPGFRTISLMALIQTYRGRVKLVANLHGIPQEAEFYSGSKVKEKIFRTHWRYAVTFLRTFDSIVVLSTYMRKIALGLGIEGRKIALIPNGIPDNLIDSVPKVVTTDTILCYGNLYPIKGQDLLIRAYSRSEASKTHRLVLVGGGSLAFRDSCARLASRMGVKDKVVFAGFQDRKALIGYMMSAKVCVFPSRLEPAGTGILEAMAVGRPVIATSNGGPPDYIENGRDALLVNPNDTETLSALLDRVCMDPKLRAKLEANSVLKAKQYAWSKLVQRYLSLYTELCSKGQ